MVHRKWVISPSAWNRVVSHRTGGKGTQLAKRRFWSRFTRGLGKPVKRPSGHGRGMTIMRGRSGLEANSRRRWWWPRWRHKVAVVSDADDAEARWRRRWMPRPPATWQGLLLTLERCRSRPTATRMEWWSWWRSGVSVGPSLSRPPRSLEDSTLDFTKRREFPVTTWPRRRPLHRTEGESQWH